LLTKGRQSPAGEEHNPLQLLIEEEIVEAPQRALLAKGIRPEVRVVRVDVTVHEVDLLVQGDPQLVVDLAVQRVGRNTQEIVNVACYKLQVRLLCELRGLGISEIIIREGRVQRRYQVEQCLPVDGITQDRQAVATLVL